MKKVMKWYIASFLMLFSLNAMAQDTAEDWDEIYRENNVVFLAQHNASRITKIVNTVIKVQNLNDYKVFVQFTPMFYCNGAAGEAQTKEEEHTYLGVGEEGNSSLHAFQICAVGNTPLIKIEKLTVHQTNELDAAKQVKH
jgi:hypothetical protein